ncbi:MAG: CAAX prenyl protease-related protein, partial [Anaeromyxobacteraceae bacterium]
AAVATALVTALFAEGFDRWYAARIAAAAAALVLVRRSLPRLEPRAAILPILIGAAVCALWLLPSGGEGAGAYEGMSRLSAGERWLWVAGRVLGSCLVVPVVEELAFRGFLLPWLVRPDFERVAPRAWTWPALLLSSLAFGALHSHWLLGAAAGMAFAAARLHRGRLEDAILAHAVANAGVAVAVLTAGRWDLWG